MPSTRALAAARGPDPRPPRRRPAPPTSGVRPGELEEQRLEVRPGLDPRGVDARRRERPVELRGPRRDRSGPSSQPGSRARVSGVTVPAPGDRLERRRRRAATSAGATRIRIEPSSRSSVSTAALADQPAAGDDPHDVDELLDLGQDVARRRTRSCRPPRARAACRACPTMPGRVEAVRGLVEQQQARVGQQRRRDPEPLLHPQRVPRHAVAGPVAQVDERQQLVDRATPGPARPWPRARAGSRGRTGTGRTTATR